MESFLQCSILSCNPPTLEELNKEHSKMVRKMAITALVFFLNTALVFASGSFLMSLVIGKPMFPDFSLLILMSFAGVFLRTCSFLHAYKQILDLRSTLCTSHSAILSLKGSVDKVTGYIVRVKESGRGLTVGEVKLLQEIQDTMQPTCTAESAIQEIVVSASPVHYKLSGITIPINSETLKKDTLIC